MSDLISITMDGGVADVRLTRPDKMNALSDGMFKALIETGDALKADTSVRAVVLSGTGRAFCAGLDLGNFAGMAGGGQHKVAGATLEERSHGISNGPQHAVMVWRQIPVPVIAAVHGVAFGGGFQLCLGADIRYVAPDTKLSIMEAKWGLVPDMAGMVLLRGLLRDDVMRELIYTGRIFSGEEAKGLGIATKVCTDPLAEALALAREIAGKSPDAVRAAKRLCNQAGALDDAALLLAESIEQAALIGSPNQIEAVMANLEKRPPRFADPAA